MTASHPGLYLVSPVVADADAFASELEKACAAGEVAATLLRLAPADERTLINRLKRLAPLAQEAGAAVLIPHDIGFDAATVMARGGADGVHVGAADLAALRDLRRRLGSDRSLGAGGLASRDEAMEAGEVPCDYLLFGEPRDDGTVPAIEAVLERVTWWTEIFVTPCAAFAPSLETVGRVAATGAEFVALGDAVWTHPEGPAAAVAHALRAIAAAETR
jgi:thiamine-phosphate pyrophosphorylase